MKIRDRIKSLRRVKASELRPNPRNWREHPEAQRAALQGVLAEIGYADACLARELSDGSLELVDGHLRADLDPDEKLPVLILDISETEAAKLLTVLDPLGAMATADTEALGKLLGEIDTESADLRKMLEGLADEHGLDVLQPGTGEAETVEPQIDRAAQLREKWGAEPDQLWTIPSKTAKGAHRVLCGDSRKVADVGRVCGGKVNGCFTSPPYAEQRKKQYGGIPADEYVDWWEPIQANVRAVLAKDASLFVNIKPHCEGLDRSLYVMDLVVAHVRRWGWHFAEEFCWERVGIPCQVVQRFKNQFEPVYQFALGRWKIRAKQVRHQSEDVPIPLGPGRAGDTNAAKRQGRMSAVAPNEVAPGMAYPGNRISVAQNTEALGHPAAFPPGLPAWFMRAFSDPGDRWLDPFLGSGSTMVAAEGHGRLCRGLEIEPEYVAVTLERMTDLGLQPKLLKSNA